MGKKETTERGKREDMSALRFAVVATLALFAVCALAQAKDFVSCGADTDDFQISELNVTPDPPVMGQNVTVSAAVTLEVVRWSSTHTHAHILSLSRRCCSAGSLV